MKMHKKIKSMTTVLTNAIDCIPTHASSVNILKKRAERIARIEIKKIQETDLLSYVHFKLGHDGHFGIPYPMIKEVIHHVSITFLPCTMDFIAGVINRRGLLINVVDLNKLFGMQSSVNTINPHIIIVQNKIMQVGLLVDSIEGSDFFSIGELKEPLLSNSRIKQNAIIGLHHGIVAIIDIEKILSEIEAQLK